MYKIIDDNSIEKIGVCIIPRDELNTDYQQFVADVVGIGTTCVEGADKVVTTPYSIARAVEYPTWQEQQDMQYWDAINGTTTWKDKITEIKNKYAKSQVGVTTIADLPDWVVGLST
tara:strand:+ start:1381 stop:1728 length:348 start_codon:yes stop_codon:yes gene_type:complete